MVVMEIREEYMAHLFAPMTLGNLVLENRIIIAPMCQYSATDQGEITAWHRMHWLNLALSGAGLLIIEATAVSPEGRISYADTGIWNDQQAARMAELVQDVRQFSPMPLAIQLAHAGRKASTDLPWQGGQQLAPDHAHGWQTVAPSDKPFKAAENPPKALSLADIARIKQDFSAAAVRSKKAGFDLIELHAAHGYLLHQFLSPLANERTDQYGGSLDNRIRLVLEVFESMQQAVGKDYPIGVRISATDWCEAGWDLAQSIVLSQALSEMGAVYIHVSSGGLDESQQIPVAPKYQVSLAAEIKKLIKIPVIAVGLITDPEDANQIIIDKDADAVAIARAILYDPRWPWHAAAQLKQKITVAPQYLRCQPDAVKQLFDPFDL